MSATLTGGSTYYFELSLYGTTSGIASGSGNPAYDLNGGTATATSLVGEGVSPSGPGARRNSAPSRRASRPFGDAPSRE
jgi:hypothetical protein